MEDINIIIPFLTALIPLIIGAVYYHPKVFGTVWMRVSGTTEAQIKSGNMAVIFGLCYLFGLIIAGFLMQITIHQSDIPSLFIDSEKYGIAPAEADAFVKEFMEKYGKVHRSFTHGAVHGLIATLFFVFPVVAINALFERRGWKYIWIHVGYWAISLILMGGVICAFV